MRLGELRAGQVLAQTSNIFWMLVSKFALHLSVRLEGSKELVVLMRDNKPPWLILVVADDGSTNRFRHQIPGICRMFEPNGRQYHGSSSALSSSEGTSVPEWFGYGAKGRGVEVVIV
jgi:hypothetical protein